jgi:hypothetical protein
MAIGPGSKGWLTRYDGYSVLTVLPASSMATTATVHVAYDTNSGPKGGSVQSMSTGLGLVEIGCTATVTVRVQAAAAEAEAAAQQPAAAAATTAAARGRRGAASSANGATGMPICTVKVRFQRTMVLRPRPQQQQQQGGYWRDYSRDGCEWQLGCVALNTFTGDVLQQEPPAAEQPLPIILLDAPATDAAG